jgi:hypothetical protein
VKAFREFRRGDDLTVHLKDGTSVRGSFVRVSRSYVQLEEYSIEAGGQMLRMKGVRLLVPRGEVKLVEVNGA